ncbi:uncharacterized protein LOC116445393 isoform X2 [Corvus moneduloides]|uniref:uncharacterized protein LOC116445393 isoform X2 n=1 Tax=Corvus moneduloides TaxID=1196302 RepID=UPI001362304F|nr:uncharacterized protein LOC116445393 isoform X2 [Corvus moneduloides]
MDGPGRYLQWAGECLPLQEKQSRWPGLLEEQLKLSVGDKRDNELLPGSPGLFPNAIPWLCNLLLLEFEHNLFLSRSPASLGQDLSQSLLGPGSEREAANGAGEFLGALWQRTSRTASSPSWTAGMPSIALVSEWEWLLGALAGPAPFQGKADERIKMQRNKCCKPPRLSDRANLPVMPVHRSERLWDHKVFQESKTRTEMWE